MGEPESAGVRRWKCPMCGGNEWLFTVESFVLHRICKQCGFEVKEMADEALKKNQNLYLYSRAYKRAKVRRESVRYGVGVKPPKGSEARTRSVQTR